jgi:hypothetical protein
MNEKKTTPDKGGLDPIDSKLLNEFAEENRKSLVLNRLASLCTDALGLDVRFVLDLREEVVDLYVGGRYREKFSIWGDSPMSVFFDAVESLSRNIK